MQIITDHEQDHLLYEAFAISKQHRGVCDLEEDKIFNLLTCSKIFYTSCVTKLSCSLAIVIQCFIFQNKDLKHNNYKSDITLFGLFGIKSKVKSNLIQLKI